MSFGPANLSLDDIGAESERLTAAIREAKVGARLTGGLAIRRRCPSARVPPLSRAHQDIDLAVGAAADGRRLAVVLRALGYLPDEAFNTLNGHHRLSFADPVTGRHLDVFVGAIRMCHVIHVKDRIALLDETLTPTDLLLSKLQIVELNNKDVLDLAALLVDTRVQADAPDAIDTAYLQRLWADDWPLWRTCGMTFEKVQLAIPGLLTGEAHSKVMANLALLRELRDTGAKSLKWRLRARVGDRLRWYENPEEVD